MGGGDLCLAHFIHVSIRIRPLVHSQRETLLLHNGIFITVNRGIDAHTENMLMVLGEGAGADDVSPGRCLAGVHVDNGHDACGAGFHDNAGCLVELVIKDIFVVGEGDDELDNQLAATRYHGAAGSPVSVFPADAVILLVQTDDVLGFLRRTICIGEDTVKVLKLLVMKLVSLGLSLP